MSLLVDGASPLNSSPGSPCAPASQSPEQRDQIGSARVHISELQACPQVDVHALQDAPMASSPSDKGGAPWEKEHLDFCGAGDDGCSTPLPLGLDSTMILSPRVKGGGAGSFIAVRDSTDSFVSTTRKVNRSHLAKFIRSNAFETLASVLVILNFIFLYLDTDARAEYPGQHQAMDPPVWLSTGMYVLFVLFCIECVLRLYVERRRYFGSWGNRLDIILVGAGVVEIAFFALDLREGRSGLSLLRVARLCRLLRLKRVFKLVSGFAELNRLVQMMGGCFKTLFWSLLLLIIVMTIWSVAAVELVNPYVQVLASGGQWHDCERCRTAFASVFMANLTFFQTVVAGDNWGLLAVPLIEAYPLTGIILVGAIMTLVFGTLNLIVAVIVDTSAENRLNDIKQMAKEMDDHEIEEKETLRGIFKQLDSDDNGTLSFPELVAGASRVPALARWLRVLDIDEGDLQYFFEMIDKEGIGEISLEDFARGMYRMKNADPRTTTKFTKHILADMDARYTCALENICAKIDYLETTMVKGASLAAASNRASEIGQAIPQCSAQQRAQLEQQEVSVSSSPQDLESIRLSLEQALAAASLHVVDHVLCRINEQADCVSKSVVESVEEASSAVESMEQASDLSESIQRASSVVEPIEPAPSVAESTESPKEGSLQHHEADMEKLSQHSCIKGSATATEEPPKDVGVQNSECSSDWGSPDMDQSWAAPPAESAQRGPMLNASASNPPDCLLFVSDAPPPKPYDSL